MPRTRDEDKKKLPSAGTEQATSTKDISIVAQIKQKDNRKRNWKLLVYPDSAPANWREILDDMQIEWIESPLHDKDTNKDGSLKKAHWHVILLFDGNKSFEQIKEIADSINSPSPQFVQNVRTMTRYLAHLDSPSKYQYSKSDIVAHGGVDLAELLKPTASSRYEMIAEMIEFIEKESVTEFIDFMLYCKNKRYDDWFPIMCDSGAFVIREVIKSKRYKPKPTGQGTGLAAQALKEES